MDMQSLEGIYWIDDADTLPYWSKASGRCARFCTGTMRHFDRQLLHAAVIGTEHGGVVITGSGRLRQVDDRTHLSRSRIDVFRRRPMW